MTAPSEVDAALDTLQHRMSAKQIRSIAESVRFTVALWVGAVSAGKTFASLIAFLLAVRMVPPGERIIIVGRTLRTIEGNIIELLQDRKRFGILADEVVHTKGASTAIILGRLVELIGAPTKLAEGNIRGGTIALAYVDEVTLIPQEFWAMLMTRLRIVGARCIATTNPGSRNHWLRKEYILQAATWDMVVFHFTMRDNPSLDLGYVLRMVRSFAGVFYDRFILGLWTNAAGAIYDMFDPAHHVIPFADMPTIARVLGVGVDYGASHATAVIMLGLTDEYDGAGRWCPRLIAMDEWRHKVGTTVDAAGELQGATAQMAPSDMAKHIRMWLRKEHTPDRQLVRAQYIWADPSAKGFREELKREGVRTIAADNDVLAGISDVMSLLAQGRLIITDRCVGLLEEITEYVWNEKKTDEGLDEPVKLNDDSLDALRYVIRSSRGVWIQAFRQAYSLAA
jgi:PBSX family phage terminase large subunit